MKFILRKALKYKLLLTFLLSILTNIQSHRGGGRRGEHGPRKSQFDPQNAHPDPIVSKDYKEPKKGEPNKDDNFGPRKKYHYKGFKINNYLQEDQFLTKSEICPEHSILINGDCVDLVDVGLITFLAMIISAGLCLLIFVAFIIGLVYLCRIRRRKLKMFRKLKKLFGFRRKKIPSNSHQELNETHSIEDNINNNTFYNPNNNINPQANIRGSNSNNNQHYSNRANINVTNYSNLSNKNNTNSNYDFAMYPNYIIDNNSGINDSSIVQSNENPNNQINLKAKDSTVETNNSLGRKINGILNYFPSLGKKIINNTFKKNTENEIGNHKQVEMNANTDVKRTIIINEPNSTFMQEYKNHNNNHYQNSSNTYFNPFLQTSNNDIINEIPSNQQKNIFVNQDNFEQNHIVIRGLGNNIFKNTLVHDSGDVCSNIPMDHKNNYFNYKNGICNQANNNSFDYRKFDEIPNEFANNINYPSLDKVEYDANCSNEGLIKRYKNEFK